MRWTHVVLAAALYLGMPGDIVSQEVLDVRQLMTAAELRATGVGGLTAQQIESLNAWLLLFTMRVATVVQTQAPSTSPSGTPAVIESKIDGEFQCWDGETVFRLMNGQIWQQSQYAYRYCYKYMPSVTIVRMENGTYRMTVEGVDGSIGVRRLR